jgi:hypothetical protein
MVSGILALTLVKQLCVAVPSMVVGTQTLTAAIKGIFKIENSKINKAISWVMAILVGLGFVAFNGLAIVSNPIWINYVFGAVAGALAGIQANGLYEFDSIWSFCNAITNMFNPERKAKQQAEKLAKLNNNE